MWSITTTSLIHGSNKFRPKYQMCFASPAWEGEGQAVIVSLSVLPIYLLWNAAHRLSVLFCSVQPRPASLIVCPHRFHSPGSLWGFFFPLGRNSQGYCAGSFLIYLLIYLFLLEVRMCVELPSVCLWSSWAQVSVLLWLSSGQFNFLFSVVLSDILLLLLPMFWYPVNWER